MIYIDGEFASEAQVSIFDRGFLFGDGAYATIRVEEGEVFFLETHLERLKKQLEGLGIAPKAMTEKEIKTLIEKNGAQTGVWKLRILVTGGSNREMRLPKGRTGHLIAYLEPFTPPSNEPLRLALYPNTITSPHSTFKSLAHLSRYYVMEYGKSRGCDDALTKTEHGFLLECAFGNFFWIEEKRLYTPDPALPYHFGVTISKIIEGVQTLGYSVHFAKKGIEDLSPEAYLFRCNTMSGLKAIKNLEGRQFPRDLDLEEKLNYLMRPSSIVI